MNRIDFEHAHVEIHCLVDDISRIVYRLARRAELRDRDESFDIVANVDDNALVHQAHDFARQVRPNRIGLANSKPRIFLGLLEAERDALVLGIDVQNDDVDGITLLHDLRRMLHALRPAHIRNVNEPVDSRLYFNKGAEAGQIADFSIDASSNGILQRQHHPWILLGLLHTERDLLLIRIDLEHDGFDRFADRHELRWMAHIARPAHLADVDEAFDARLELDKRPIVGNRDDLARDARSDWVLLRDVLPRIALQLFETEADALAGPVDVEHLDLELRADGDELRRMRDAAP